MSLVSVVIEANKLVRYMHQYERHKIIQYMVYYYITRIVMSWVMGL